MKFGMVGGLFQLVSMPVQLLLDCLDSNFMVEICEFHLQIVCLQQPSGFVQTATFAQTPFVPLAHAPPFGSSNNITEECSKV